MRCLPSPSRRFIAPAIAAAVLAGGGTAALAQQPSSQARAQLSEAQTQGASLRSRIAAGSARIEQLQASITELDSRLRQLESDLRSSSREVKRLGREADRQQRQLERLERRLRSAKARLVARVVSIYQGGELTLVSSLIGSGSIDEVFARHDAAQQLAEGDRDLLNEVRSLEQRVRSTRERTMKLHRSARRENARIARDRREAVRARAELASEQQALVAAVQTQSSQLTSVQAREALLEANLTELEAASSTLQQTIENQSASPITSTSPIPPPAAPTPTPVSGGGMVWPVSGPIVSAYGPRGGRMHSGVDIAAPSGTPLRAASGGTVIFAGWMDGYGNLVVIQHAGGLSTAYAHQSQIASANGQGVSQGQVIGYVGCTGRCFGDHVHFETRVNGSAVDPMNYL